MNDEEESPTPLDLLIDLVECYDVDSYQDFVLNLPTIIEDARKILTKRIQNLTTNMWDEDGKP